MDALYGLTPGLLALVIFAAILLGFVAWNILKFLFFAIGFKGLKQDKEEQRKKLLKNKK